MKFEILKNSQVIKELELNDGSYKIGRSSDCEIELSSPQVSKKHGLLVIKGGKAAIIDTGSSNGIFVNGILIKKQRIEKRDEVAIANFIIREKRSTHSLPREPSVQGFSGVEMGNAAVDLSYSVPDPEPEAELELSPQQRVVRLVDQKALRPVYSLMKEIDWRIVIGGIVMGSLILSMALSVIPVLNWGKELITREALQRAHTVLSQTVRENHRVLTKTNDFTRLTVEAAEKERGILRALIIEPKSKTILAPREYFGKTVVGDQADPETFTKLALERVIRNKEEIVSVDKGDGYFMVAQPIYIFSQEKNDRELVAIVLGEFQVPDQTSSTYDQLLTAALIAVLISLIALYFVFQLISYPILTMNEQLDSALRGENVNISCESRFPELETLATVINFSVNKLRQAEGGGLGGLDQDNSEAEDLAYLQTIREFDVASPSGLLVLDPDKRVHFVGHVLEDLISLRSQYAIGQNISDACKDGSFAGTAIDLADSVLASLGESQQAELDINGIPREIVGIAHKNSVGKIRFILILVKMEKPDEQF